MSHTPVRDIQARFLPATLIKTLSCLSLYPGSRTEDDLINFSLFVLDWYSVPAIPITQITAANGPLQTTVDQILLKSWFIQQHIMCGAGQSFIAPVLWNIRAIRSLRLRRR